MNSDIILRFHNLPRIETLEVYRRNGGYQALAKAARIGGKQVIGMVIEAGLRGRGGSGFPTGQKWEAVCVQERRPHYFICNIAEGEPGSFKDRELIKNPHQVLEATAIAAYSIGAEKAFIYLRGAFVAEEGILKQALIQARTQRLLGQNGLLPVEIVIHRGVDSYIAGEETALLESLEGKPAIPRVKPPRPHEEGLWGAPTVVNNIETICNVIPILLQGPGSFRKYGTSQSPGTKLFCLSGRISRPGLYEMPLGIRLSQLLNECGGGPLPDCKLRAVFPGGPSTSIVPVDLDPCMDYESLKSAGSSLGTGGVIVLDDTCDMRKIAVETSGFFATESCGACPPCTIGTSEVRRYLETHDSAGRIEAQSLSKVRELCEMMKYRGQCAHCRAAALTTLSLLERFPEAFS